MGNKSNNQGLGVAKLALFAIGLTLASGVFSLSGDFAAGGAHTLAAVSYTHLDNSVDVQI